MSSSCNYNFVFSDTPSLCFRFSMMFLKPFRGRGAIEAFLILGFSISEKKVRWLNDGHLTWPEATINYQLNTIMLYGGNCHGQPHALCTCNADPGTYACHVYFDVINSCMSSYIDSINITAHYCVDGNLADFGWMEATMWRSTDNYCSINTDKYALFLDCSTL